MLLLNVHLYDKIYILEYIHLFIMRKKSVLSRTDEEELLTSVDSGEKITKDSSISWDGLNLLVRIPKEIAEYLSLDKNNRFEKSFRFMISDDGKNAEKTFDVVERTRPKREFKKNGKKSR